MTQEKTKILMYRTHIAYIDKHLLQAFDRYCPQVNFSAWIRQQAKRDFGLTITCREDLMRLDELVIQHYYSDKTEWLREKMRTEVKRSCENNTKD